MIILLNVEWAAEQLWGGEHRLALQNIRHAYPYDTVHDATSCTVLMKEIAVADETRDRRTVKSPGGMSNTVEQHAHSPQPG